MAIFGRKTNKTNSDSKQTAIKDEIQETKELTTSVKKSAAKKTTKKEKKEASTPVATANTPHAKTDYKYRITEKATYLSDKNIYTVNIPASTNKIELKKDLEKKYKVKVLNINIINIAKKHKLYRGKPGYRGGGKKAYVTLKKGDSLVL